jgi:hypothetical protein
MARLLTAERRVRGTRRGTRALTRYYQALMVLVWFRKRGDMRLLAAGFGISRPTAYRYRQETVEVGRPAPDPHQALERVQIERWAFVIVDGSIITADRDAAPTVSVKGKDIDLWYSGKAGHHGENLHAIMRPDGFPVCLSGVVPGSVHDFSAARESVLGPCTPVRRPDRPFWPTVGTSVQARACMCP